jgi:hypothetical protein
VAEDPVHRARVGPDEIEAMLDIPLISPVGGWYLRNMDPRVVAAVQGAVRGLLRAGFDVVLDHPHLLPELVDQAERLAVRSGADFEVWDMMDVPVGICVERDARRGLDGGHAVGAKRICELWEVYQRHRRYDPDQERPADGVFDRMVTNITDEEKIRQLDELGLVPDDRPFREDVDPWPEGEALRSEVVDAETMAVLPPWLLDKIDRALKDPSTLTRGRRRLPDEEEKQ